MRLIETIRNDIRFQMRYGFYFLYIFITILYSGVLLLVPDQYKDLTASIIIMSDPAMLGFFFIGGIWLLEKNEGVQKFLVISPLTPIEYILGKAVSLGLISTLSSLVLMIVGQKDPASILAMLPGIFIGSAVFTILGMIVGTYARSVNNYLLISIPAEIFITLPTMLFAFGVKVPGLSIFPGAMVWQLVRMTQSTRASADTLIIFAGLLVWLGIVLFAALQRIPRALTEEGDAN